MHEEGEEDQEKVGKGQVEEEAVSPLEQMPSHQPLQVLRLCKDPIQPLFFCNATLLTWNAFAGPPWPIARSDPTDAKSSSSSRFVVFWKTCGDRYEASGTHPWKKSTGEAGKLRASVRHLATLGSATVGEWLQWRRGQPLRTA